VYYEHVDVDGDHIAREPVPRAVAVLAADERFVCIGCAAGLSESELDARIQPGTLTLDSFTYTLTFAGFTSPYITITASDP
jgi:hypothetical protein